MASQVQVSTAGSSSTLTAGIPGVPVHFGQGGIMSLQGSSNQSVGAFTPAMTTMTSVYSTNYGGVDVLEALVRGISVMMRRDDQWVNATQILKVSGVGKAERDRLLEREIGAGPHEKVDGKGYGKYQGVWAPLSTGMDLANKYGVGALLAPVFSLQQGAALNMPSSTGNIPASSLSQRAPSPSSAPRRPGSTANATNGSSLTSPFTHTALPRPGQNYTQASAQTGYSTGGTSQTAVPQQQLSLQSQSQQQLQQQTPVQQTSQPVYSMYPPHTTTASQGYYIPSYTSMPAPMSTSSKRPLEEEPRTPNRNGQPVAKKIRTDDADLAVFFEPAQPVGFADDADLTSSPPPGTRLASKPSRPTNASPLSDRMSRSKLLAIFEAQEHVEIDLDAFISKTASSPLKPGLEQDETDLESSLDIDQAIDERGHSALHWAAALARQKLVDQLIGKGADIHRGNFAGETPLIRAALTTNNADRPNAFSDLLERRLGPSLRTLDNSHRTVLHHIALVAGIRGRSAAAVAYMGCVLEYLAKNDPQMKEFVNIQDLQGDTALIIAARVGNSALVKLLLDAGADKTKSNKMGLRAADFGLEVEGLGLPNGPARPSLPHQNSSSVTKKCQGLVQRLTETLGSLQRDFSTELSVKHEKFENLQADVIAASRSVASLRQQLKKATQHYESIAGSLQRGRNLQRSIEQEGSYAWVAEGGEDGTEPAADGSALELRRLRDWHTASSGLLNEKLQSAEQALTSSQRTCRKAIAAIMKVSEDQVDDSALGDLASSIDAPGNVVKVADFIDRIIQT